MNLLAIDPGNTETAYVLFDSDTQAVIDFGKIPNANALELCETIAGNYSLAVDHVAIEMIASYGMPVGREVFDTCVWIGRFIERISVAFGIGHTLVYRREVKLHVCGQARAKDGNIRAALIDRWGGKDNAIGKKASPGPLYGIAADIWAALAVAVTFTDQLAGRDFTKGLAT